MQKSVFLPLWDNYELYGDKFFHIESFSTIECENLEFQNSSYERSTHGELPRIINRKKRNILQLSEAVGILHVLTLGALECNLTRRCPFFKSPHNPFRKRICILILCFRIFRLQNSRRNNREKISILFLKTIGFCS